MSEQGSMHPQKKIESDSHFKRALEKLGRRFFTPLSIQPGAYEKPSSSKLTRGERLSSETVGKTQDDHLQINQPEVQTQSETVKPAELRERLHRINRFKLVDSLFATASPELFSEVTAGSNLQNEEFSFPLQKLIEATSCSSSDYADALVLSYIPYDERETLDKETASHKRRVTEVGFKFYISFLRTFLAEQAMYFKGSEGFIKPNFAVQSGVDNLYRKLIGGVSYDDFQAIIESVRPLIDFLTERYASATKIWHEYEKYFEALSYVKELGEALSQDQTNHILVHINKLKGLAHIKGSFLEFVSSDYLSVMNIETLSRCSQGSVQAKIVNFATRAALLDTNRMLQRSGNPTLQGDGIPLTEDLAFQDDLFESMINDILKYERISHWDALMLSSSDAFIIKALKKRIEMTAAETVQTATPLSEEYFSSMVDREKRDAYARIQQTLIYRMGWQAGNTSAISPVPQALRQKGLL